MNFKKFLSLLFVMLFGTAVAFAANNTRNVYSVYSDNFNGAHFDAPSSDEDSIQLYPWEGTVSIAAVDTNAPEGKKYTRLTWGTLNWTGCGWTSTNSNGYHDMSAYDGGKIKFLARSSDSNVVKCRIGIKINNMEIYKTLESLGFSANGQWQEITINLNTSTDSNITSANLAKTNILFIVSQNVDVVSGDILDVDNIRWVKSGDAATLSVVRKKVSDNTEVSEQTISFSTSTFGQGWSVADQYLEMDVDGDFSSNNWRVNVYSSATEDEKAGLYNATINDKLPMAWKVSCSTLPYNYTDSDGANINTLQIGENKDEASGTIWGLYDAGKVAIKGDGAKWWYPWFYVQKSGVKDDNTLVLNNIGCHTFENDNISYFDTNESAIVASYERKPKLYIACDTKSAKAVKYEASLIINLSYE